MVISWASVRLSITFILWNLIHVFQRNNEKTLHEMLFIIDTSPNFCRNKDFLRLHGPRRNTKQKKLKDERKCVNFLINNSHGNFTDLDYVTIIGQL